MMKLVPIILIVAMLVLQGCHFITPVEMTNLSIVETFSRIHLFMQKEGNVPKSIEELPRREGYANRTTDGWGRQLDYTVSPNGVLTLKSLGRDGKIGGSEEDADISRSYRIVDENGKSSLLSIP